MRDLDGLPGFNKTQMAFVPAECRDCLKGAEVRTDPHNVDVAIAIEVTGSQTDLLQRFIRWPEVRNFAKGSIPFGLDERKGSRVGVNEVPRPVMIEIDHAQGAVRNAGYQREFQWFKGSVAPAKGHADYLT